jgi:WD40 repeat protein
MDLHQEAWGAISDRKGLRKKFEAAAKKDDDAGLALARFDALLEHDEVGAALRVEGPQSVALILPLAMATCLAADDDEEEDEGEELIEKIDGLLGKLKFVFTLDAAPSLHQVIAKAQKQAKAVRANKKTASQGDGWDMVEGRAAAALARLGDTKEAERLVGKYPSLRTVLLPRGVGVADAIKQLEKDEEDEEDSLRTIAELLLVLAEAKVTDAVPGMIRYLHSGIFIHACDALATIGDPRAIEPVKKMLRETCGEDWSVNIHRLAAEHVLRVVAGEKLPLDLARKSVTWPQIDYRSTGPEALVLRKMAITALILHGDEADREVVRRQIRSPYRIVRDAALAAFDAPPVLTVWDQGRIAFAKKKGGVKALIAALEDPNALFPDLIVKALAEDNKAKAPEVTAFMLREIEERMAAYPHFDDDIELDADIDTYVEVASELGLKKPFAASKNPWVRTRILEEDEEKFAKSDEEERKEKDRGPRKVTVTRLDHPAYFFGDVTKATLADQAERVLLVAGAKTYLFDPQKSERLSEGSADGPVSAAILTADGKRYALAVGNKISVHDDDDKATLVARIETSHEVSAMAFDPEGGKLLAVGTKSGALRFFDAASGKEVTATEGLKDAPGAIRGVGWLSAKRCVFLADKAKKSMLIDIDVPKAKRGADVAIDFSERMVVSGKTLVTWTDKMIRVHDAKLAPKVKIAIDADDDDDDDDDKDAKKVLDVAIENEKGVIVRYADRVERIKFSGKAPKHETVSHMTIEHLLASTNRIYGVAAGAMTRFHEDKKGKVAAGCHYDHVKGIGVLPNGEGVITSGWEGRVLRWSPEGGLATTLYDRKERVDWLAMTPNGERAYFDDEKNVRMIDTATGEVSIIVGGEKVEKDLAKHMPEVKSVAASDDLLVWGDNNGFVHIVNAKTGEETASVQIGDDDVESVAIDQVGNVYGGLENGTIACIDEKSGTKKWSRVEHGRDVLDGELHGNPHRNVAYLHAQGRQLASLASDHTVRVFDGPTGERKLRCYRNVGIFNHVRISPDNSRIAFTYNNDLEVWRIEDGKMECSVDELPTSGESEPTAVAWVNDRELLVGTEGGAIYRVTLQ